VGFPLPNVTHDAAAVTVAVRIQDQNRHRSQLRKRAEAGRLDAMLHHATGARRTLFPPTRRSLPRALRLRRIRRSMGARTHRGWPSTSKSCSPLPERAGRRSMRDGPASWIRPPTYDQFNLVAGQLGERFGRAKPGIADHQHIRYRTRLEAAFPRCAGEGLLPDDWSPWHRVRWHRGQSCVWRI
jgi:hypothetical protein